jgi:CDP-diacylglycerol--serine O-phosphatidyltransferase
VALLVTYPYETLTALTLIYIGAIPMSWRRFQEQKEEALILEQAGAPQPEEAGTASAPAQAPALGKDAGSRVLPLRPGSNDTR